MSSFSYVELQEMLVQMKNTIYTTFHDTMGRPPNEKELEYLMGSSDPYKDIMHMRHRQLGAERTPPLTPVQRERMNYSQQSPKIGKPMKPKAYSNLPFHVAWEALLAGEQISRGSARPNFLTLSEIPRIMVTLGRDIEKRIDPVVLDQQVLQRDVTTGKWEIWVPTQADLFATDWMIY